MATQDSEAGQEQHDSVGEELDSMRRIAKALDGLHDDATRQRVLQWANERYHGRGTTIVPQPGTAAANAVAPPPRTGVESMIKDFAADFRRFALEWQGA